MNQQLGTSINPCNALSGFNCTENTSIPQQILNRYGSSCEFNNILMNTHNGYNLARQINLAGLKSILNNNTIGIIPAIQNYYDSV